MMQRLSSTPMTSLTSYINGARARIVRDTGCNHAGVTDTMHSRSGWKEPRHLGCWISSQHPVRLYSNVFIYKVTAGGVLGTIVPPYPWAQTSTAINTIY